MNKVRFTPQEIIQREYRFGNYCWLHNKRGRSHGLVDIWDPRRIDDPYTLYLAVVGDGFSMPMELNPDILGAITDIKRTPSPKKFVSSTFEPFKVEMDEDKIHYIVSFNDVKIGRVRYIHQLQNLYHDITGADMAMPIREMLAPILWYPPEHIML